MALTVDEIAQILNTMRVENENNAQGFERILTGINAKLELMSEDNEATDLIKLYISELKKVIEDNNTGSSVKLDTLDSLLKEIVSSNKDLAKNEDITNVFNNLTTNVNIVTDSLEEQKNILAGIENKLNQTDGKILTKDELSSLLNDIFVNLSELNSNIKISFENIQNSLLNAEENLQKYDISGQVDFIHRQVGIISSDVKALPDKISEFQNITDSLKYAIENSALQNNKDLTERFDVLQNSFNSIVTEQDFAAFRQDLADFVQKIIDNSKALNSELSYSTERIESILESVKALDFRDDFENIIIRLNEIKESFEEGSKINYTNLSSEISSLSSRINTSFENLDTASKELYSDLKTETSIILENLKNLIELNPQSSIDELSSIVSGISENVNAVKDSVVSDVVLSVNENSNSNYEAVKDYINELSGNISNLKTEFDEILQKTSAGLAEDTSKISSEISQFRAEFKQSVESDLQNSALLMEHVSDVSLKVDSLNDSLNANFSDNYSSLKSILEELSRELSDEIAKQKEIFSDTNELNEQQKIETLKNLSVDIRNIELLINSNTDAFKDEIKNNILEIRDYINDIKNSISLSQSEVENKLSQKLESLEGLNHVIDGAASSVGEKIQNISDNLQLLDNSEQNNLINEKIQQINTSSSGIISSLDDLNRHNDELSKIISMMMEVVAKKDDIIPLTETINSYEPVDYSYDLEQLSSKIDNILESFDDISGRNFAGISEKLNELQNSSKTNTESVISKIDDFSIIISSLKDIIMNSNTENRDLFNGQLKNFENLYAGALTADDFANFRHDFSDFVQKIIDNANVLQLNAESGKELIAEILKKIENLGDTDRLEVIESKIDNIKDVFENNSLQNCDSILKAVDSLKEQVNSVLSDSENNRQEYFSKFETELSDISLNIQFIRDLSSQKPSEILDNVLNELKAMSASVQDGINSNINLNMKDLQLSVSNMAEEINGLKNDLSGKDDARIFSITSGFDSIRTSLEEILSSCSSLSELFENTSRTNYGNLVSSISDAGAKVEELKYEIQQTSLGYMDKVFNTVKEVSSKLDLLSENMPVDISENINTLIEKISSLADNFEGTYTEHEKLIKDCSDTQLYELKNVSGSVNDLREHFDEISESLKNYISELNIAYKSGRSDSENKITEKLLDLESSIMSNSEQYEQKIEVLQAKLSEFVHIAENSASDTEAKVMASMDEVSGLKDELAVLSEYLKSVKSASDDKLDNTVTLIDTGIDNIISKIAALNESVLSGIDVSVKENILSVDEKFDGLISAISSLKEEHTAISDGLISDLEDKISSLKQEFGIINTDISDALQCKTEEIMRAFEPVKTGIDEFIGFDFSNILQELKSGLQESFVNFTVDINGELAANSESVNKLEQAYKEVLNKINSVEECVSNKISNDIELLNITVETSARDVKHNLEEKIDDYINDLKAYIDIAFNNTRTESSIENLKEELSAKIEDIFKGQNYLTEQTNVLNAGISTLGDSIKNYVQSACENTIDKCSPMQTKELLEALNKKLDIFVTSADNEEILNYFQELQKQAKDDYATLSGLLNSISSKVEKFSDDSKLTSMLENLTSKVDVIASDPSIILLSDKVEEIYQIYSKIEKNSEDSKISDLLENLNSKVDIIASDPSVDELNERVDEIFKTEDRVAEMLTALHEKVDVLAMDGTDFDIAEEIDDIKDLIFEQRKYFETSSDEKTAAIDKYLRDVLLKLDNVDLEKNSEDIKESILNALVSLFDQISFVEETEEIKDFVEEKTDQINQNLIEVKNQLKQIASSDDDFGYSYTLQDVESDIAKLRLAINNMSGNDFESFSEDIKKIVTSVKGLESTLTQDQMVDLKTDIEKLNEDILSISSRTNKLLLTSDESYKALNDGLNNFSNLVYRLEDRIDNLDNSGINDRLERKVDNIHSMAVEGANADKVFHQVMMYLGEWVDSTTENIASLLDKTAEITDLKNDFEQLRELLPEKTQIVDELEEKFEQQELRIDRLEMKLDKILSALEEKDDMMLNRKVDKIEKLISRLGTNIDKLTSYVDEE